MSKETPVQDRSNSDIYSQPVDDGLLNVMSNLGTKKARDPYTRLSYDHRLDRIELEDIYRCYWIAKAVDIKPWDMTREWRTFCGDDISPDQIEAIEEEERKVEAASDVREALQWASLYGGAGIVMHVDGHGKMSEPLDVTKIKKGQLNRLSPADRWELIPAVETVDYNPLSPTFGTAPYYRVATDTLGTLIHRSRIIFFRGRKMPIRVTRQLLGWGESDVQRWYKAITNNETLAVAIIEGVHQANIDVVAAKGLAQTLAMAGGEEKIQNRFMTMDYCKSLLNMAVIDGEDTLTRNAFPFSGLPDIKRVFLDELASATDIPVTRLLGSSPGGLNATGESDTRNYYDMIAAMQENMLAPKLYQLDQVLVRSALGDYPEGLSFEFNPLWQMSDQEEAQLRQTQVQTLVSLQQLGIDDFTLQKDAVELGLVKNLDLENIEAAEQEDDFGIEEGNEDFEPDTTPDDDGSGGAGSGEIDELIESLISNSKPDKKKDDGGQFNKVTKTGRRYRETPSGNRVYQDWITDEENFKEEKHKRDKSGKFSSTGGGGSSGGEDAPQEKTTAEKLVEARENTGKFAKNYPGAKFSLNKSEVKIVSGFRGPERGLVVPVEYEKNITVHKNNKAIIERGKIIKEEGDNVTVRLLKKEEVTAHTYEGVTGKRFPYSKDTFFFGTETTFNEDKRPSRDPDFESSSGSKYWYSDDGVIRESDHWGIVASCLWQGPSGNVGFSRWEDFKTKNSPIDSQNKIRDEENFKEEKHKRDKDGKFATTGSGKTGREDVPQGKQTAEKLVKARESAGSDKLYEIMESDQHDYLKLKSLLEEKYGDNIYLKMSEDELEAIEKLEIDFKAKRSNKTIKREYGSQKKPEEQNDSERLEKLRKKAIDSAKAEGFNSGPFLHGTPNGGFVKFTNKSLASNTFMENSKHGFFFTDDKDVAEIFQKTGSSGHNIKGRNPMTYEVMLKIDNPYEISAQEYSEMLFGTEKYEQALDEIEAELIDNFGHIPSEYDDTNEWTDSDWELFEKYIEITNNGPDEFALSDNEWVEFYKNLKETGHDALIVKGDKDLANDNPEFSSDNIQPFDDSQIKITNPELKDRNGNIISFDKRFGKENS